MKEIEIYFCCCSFPLSMGGELLLLNVLQIAKTLKK
jgi:predicted RNA-binding protein